MHSNQTCLIQTATYEPENKRHGYELGYFSAPHIEDYSLQTGIITFKEPMFQSRYDSIADFYFGEVEEGIWISNEEFLRQKKIFFKEYQIRQADFSKRQEKIFLHLLKKLKTAKHLTRNRIYSASLLFTPDTINVENGNFSWFVPKFHTYVINNIDLQQALTGIALYDVYKQEPDGLWYITEESANIIDFDTDVFYYIPGKYYYPFKLNKTLDITYPGWKVDFLSKVTSHLMKSGVISIGDYSHLHIPVTVISEYFERINAKDYVIEYVGKSFGNTVIQPKVLQENTHISNQPFGMMITDYKTGQQFKAYNRRITSYQ